jgi:hypothetical protein
VGSGSTGSPCSAGVVIDCAPVVSTGEAPAVCPPGCVASVVGATVVYPSVVGATGGVLVSTGVKVVVSEMRGSYWAGV